MKLNELFPQIKNATEIQGLHFDSRKVIKDSVFFALKGSAQDGHDYLEKAITNGAIALVVNDPDRVPPSFKGEVITATDTRSLMGECAKKFYNTPTEHLKLIGVTGTNGKTTSVYMFEHAFKNLGEKAGVMGTIDHHIAEKVWKSELTTPDVIGLYSRLHEFSELGADFAAMEISSHALDQKRVEGLQLDVGIWTNFTRDHLDYHKSEEEYFLAKEKLFLNHIKPGGFALINGDVDALKRIRTSPKTKRYFFGKNGDFRFEILNQSLNGIQFDFKSPFGSGPIELSVLGEHNVYNACGVLAAGLCLGFSFKDLQTSLRDFSGAPGRLELVHSSPHVFIDYAHTPDALFQSLSALKRLTRPHQKLIAAFGFGGDRDPGKRPLMLNEALKIADHIVLTSDNPRTEDPEKILKSGLTNESMMLVGEKISLEVDRKKGIHLALEKAKADDVVLIAGKGHEDYQIIGTQVFPFSDKAVVKEYVF